MAYGTVNVGQAAQKNIELATESKNGLMSAEDKKKLNGLSGDLATESKNGLMSAEDKKKLDGVSEGASRIKIAEGTMVIS